MCTNRDALSMQAQCQSTSPCQSTDRIVPEVGCSLKTSFHPTAIVLSSGSGIAVRQIKTDGRQPTQRPIRTSSLPTPLRTQKSGLSKAVGIIDCVNEKYPIELGRFRHCLRGA